MLVPLEHIPVSQIPQLVDTTCVTGLGIVHIGHADKIHLLRLMCWWPTGNGASLLLQLQTLQETRVHAAHVNIATSQGTYKTRLP